MTESLPWPPKKEDLVRLYLSEKLSASKIAKVYGLKYKNPKVAESTILYHLRKNGIQRRDAAEHFRKVEEDVVDEWVLRYRAGESLKQIAGEEVDPVTVWNHLKRRGVVLRNKVEAQIQAVRKYERKPFSGDSVEKAYLMGLRYGDLHAVRHGRAIRVRVSTTHPAMAELFLNLFSSYGHVSKYPRTAQLTGFEWTLECDLDESFEFILQKIAISELKSLPESEFWSFLAGIIDAEGTIYLHKRSYGATFEVVITNTDRMLLGVLDGRLRRHEYHTKVFEGKQDENRLGYLKPGRIFRLSLPRPSDVCRLLASVNLRHREKITKSNFVRGRYCSDELDLGADAEFDWQVLTSEVHREVKNFIRSAAEAHKESLRKKEDLSSNIRSISIFQVKS